MPLQGGFSPPWVGREGAGHGSWGQGAGHRRLSQKLGWRAGAEAVAVAIQMQTRRGELMDFWWVGCWGGEGVGRLKACCGLHWLGQVGKHVGVLFTEMWRAEGGGPGWGVATSIVGGAA